jgi:hypothetical protein
MQLDRHAELTARGGPTPDEMASWFADVAELGRRQGDREARRDHAGRMDWPRRQSADVLAVIDYLAGPDGPPICDDPIHLDLSDPDTGVIRREVIVNRENHVVDLTDEVSSHAIQVSRYSRLSAPNRVLADLRSRTPAQGQPVGIEPVASLHGGRDHDGVEQPFSDGAPLGDVESRPGFA